MHKLDVQNMYVSTRKFHRLNEQFEIPPGLESQATRSPTFNMCADISFDNTDTSIHRILLAGWSIEKILFYVSSNSMQYEP